MQVVKQIKKKKKRVKIRLNQRPTLMTDHIAIAFINCSFETNKCAFKHAKLLHFSRKHAKHGVGFNQNKTSLLALR